MLARPPRAVSHGLALAGNLDAAPDLVALPTCDARRRERYAAAELSGRRGSVAWDRFFVEGALAGVFPHDGPGPATVDLCVDDGASPRCNALPPGAARTHLADRMHGLAVGHTLDRVWTTDDGGRSWQHVALAFDGEVAGATLDAWWRRNGPAMRCGPGGCIVGEHLLWARASVLASLDGGARIRARRGAWAPFDWTAPAPAADVPLSGLLRCRPPSHASTSAEPGADTRASDGSHPRGADGWLEWSRSGEARRLLRWGGVDREGSFVARAAPRARLAAEDALGASPLLVARQLTLFTVLQDGERVRLFAATTEHGIREVGPIPHFDHAETYRAIHPVGAIATRDGGAAVVFARADVGRSVLVRIDRTGAPTQVRELLRADPHAGPGVLAEDSAGPGVLLHRRGVGDVVELVYVDPALPTRAIPLPSDAVRVCATPHVAPDALTIHVGYSQWWSECTCNCAGPSLDGFSAALELELAADGGALCVRAAWPTRRVANTPALGLSARGSHLVARWSGPATTTPAHCSLAITRARDEGPITTDFAP